MALNVISREENMVRLGCEGSSCPLQPGADCAVLEPLLGPAGFRSTVLLDLARANYLGCTEINWLIKTNQRFREEGGRLVVHSLSPWLREVANLVRLPALVSVAEDEAAAAALVRGTCP
jgi:anti-anti-sigma regulatory factor